MMPDLLQVDHHTIAILSQSNHLNRLHYLSLHSLDTCQLLDMGLVDHMLQKMSTVERCTMIPLNPPLKINPPTNEVQIIVLGQIDINIDIYGGVRNCMFVRSISTLTQ